jgi:hypothetical protein
VSSSLKVMATRLYRGSTDRAPWAVEARYAMQMAIGDQLQDRYEAPQELPEELNELLLRMNARDADTQ